MNGDLTFTDTIIHLKHPLYTRKIRTDDLYHPIIHIFVLLFALIHLQPTFTALLPQQLAHALAHT